MSNEKDKRIGFNLLFERIIKDSKISKSDKGVVRSANIEGSASTLLYLYLSLNTHESIRVRETNCHGLTWNIKKLWSIACRPNKRTGETLVRASSVQKSSF